MTPAEPVLIFPGAVLNDDPAVVAGGCEFGGTRCVEAPEIACHVPATGVVRLLCRTHAGWFMLAAAPADDGEPVAVHVLRLGASSHGLDHLRRAG